jgi:hypothetical protein
MEYIIIAGWTFLATILVGSAFKLFSRFVLKPWEDRINDLIPDVPNLIQFTGGPLNGTANLVEEIKPFYVAPYIPENEDERKLWGTLGDKPIFYPQLAYYTQISEDEYLYVRDISEQEFYHLRVTGQQPSVRTADSQE